MQFAIKSIISIYLLGMFGIFSVATAATQPQSFNGLYLGANVSKEQFKDGYTNASIAAGMFRIGYDFNKIFALEGQLGATTSKSYLLLENGEAVGDYTLRGAHSGIYGRANWRLINVSLYGLLGIGYYKKIEENKYNLHRTETTDELGFSYGAGVDLFGGQQTALSLNWMQLINKGFRVNALTLGITYYFKMQRTNHPVNPRDRLHF